MAAVVFSAAEEPIQGCENFYKKAAFFEKHGKSKEKKYVYIGHGIHDVNDAKQIIIAIEKEDNKEVVLWCCTVNIKL